MQLPSIDTSEKLIHGTIAKFVDGIWTSRESGTDITGLRLLVLHMTRAVQRWQGNERTEEYIEDNSELPNIDELNKCLPESGWELSLDGKPRPPYQKQFVTYLLDPADASIYTALNATMGMRIAWEQLKDKFAWMRAMRGAAVFPVVALSSLPMKTKLGKKQRPDFKVSEWVSLEGGGWPGLAAPAMAPALPNKPVAAIGKPVAPVTASEELNDRIPF